MYSLGHFLAFPLSSWAISTGLTGSKVEDASVVPGDCEDCSRRSTRKSLFHNLQVVCRLLEGWSIYLEI